MPVPVSPSSESPGFGPAASGSAASGSAAARAAAARLPRIDLQAEADLSRCGALAHYWYVACESRALPAAAGKPRADKHRPVHATLFGRRIVLYRDADGVVRAHDDRCLHRGAALSDGVVIGGRLYCPYHGWGYDADGRAVEVPSMGPAGPRGDVERQLPEAERTAAGLKLHPTEAGCLRTYPTLEKQGLVHVYMGTNVADARRGPVERPYWDTPGWQHYMMVTDFDNAVTHLAENFMDVPHTAFVHQGWFRAGAPKRVPATVERRAENVLVTYHQDGDRIAGLGRLLDPSGTHPMTHTDRFIAPATTRVDYAFGPRSGFVITSNITPIGPTKSRVFTAIAYQLPLDVPGRLVNRLLKPLIHWYTRQVIVQDIDIAATQARGLEANADAPVFNSTEADLLHHDIEAWRDWLREGAAPAQCPTDAERPIVFYV